MVSYTRDEIVSATELARNFSGTLNSIINEERERVAISKNNKIEAILIDIEEYERLKELYDLIEDTEIVKIIKDRNKTPKKDYISLEESAKEFGINLDEL